MTNERAIEILDPEHREQYDSIETVNEACRIGMNAIKRVQDLEAENAALRERLDKAVDKTIVSEMLAKYFDCPCNFSPLDEEMWAYCRDNCVDDNIECWIRVINKKCAELKGRQAYTKNFIWCYVEELQ